MFTVKKHREFDKLSSSFVGLPKAEYYILRDAKSNTLCRHVKDSGTKSAPQELSFKKSACEARIHIF